MRSESSHLAALAWLRESGLFHEVALIDHIEGVGYAEVQVRLTEDAVGVLRRIEGTLAREKFPDRQRSALAVELLLSGRPGCPTIRTVEVDENDDPGDPVVASLGLEFRGAKRWRRARGAGGRPGYFEGYWSDTGPAKAIIDEAARVWRVKCKTHPSLAAHLNHRGFSTLAGKPFTKGTARRVVAALEKIRSVE